MLHKLCHTLLNILHNIFIKNEWQWVLIVFLIFFFFFFYTTCKIAKSFKYRLQYSEKMHLTRTLLSSRLTFMLNESCVIVSSVTIPSSTHFSVNECALQASLDTAPVSSWLQSDTKAELTLCSMWKSYTKILHSPSVEKAVRAISTSKKKKKKKIFARVQRL